MKPTCLAFLACATALPIVPTRADTFGSGANTFTIDFVTIGNAGNGDDRAFDNVNDTPGNPNDDEYASPAGGVAYTYRMGVYEVSHEMMTKAMAGGLANVTSENWSGGQPAANLMWHEAAAFVNWLNTSTGHHEAYDLTYLGQYWDLTPWSSSEAWQLGGENLYRHKDAFYFLPSDDEWYKAAFHKNDGVTANYWDFATGSNAVPVGVTGGTAPGTVVAAEFPAAVNNAGGLSPYGTMGQNGNVYEWIESAFAPPNDIGYEERIIRGGGAYPISEEEMNSGFPVGVVPFFEDAYVGFRVASIPTPIPEPTSAALLAASAFPLLLRRRR